MADLDCTIIQKQEGKELTVGEKFALSCKGAAVKDLNPEKIELKLDDKDKYALKLFKAQKSESGDLILEVTSYLTGDRELKAVQIVDDQNSLVLGDMKLHVASVMNPQEPRKEPYGPWGPIRFFPWSVVVLLIVLLIAVITPFVALGLRRRQRRKLVDQVDSKSFQYPPFQELHRCLRQSQRNYLFLSDARAPAESNALESALGELDQSFRTYITRQFKVPALHWRAGRLVRTVQTEFPKLDEQTIHDLGLTLTELEKANRQKQNLNSQDLAQILKIIRKTSDEIYRVQRGPNE